MWKLAGGNNLSCGHNQWLSAHRLKLASAGYEQAPVWCLECEDWSTVVPQEVKSEVDKSDKDVLQ